MGWQTVGITACAVRAAAAALLLLLLLLRVWPHRDGR